MEILVYSTISSYVLSYLMLLYIVYRSVEVSVREAFLCALFFALPFVNVIIFGYEIVLAYFRK